MNDPDYQAYWANDPDYQVLQYWVEEKRMADNEAKNPDDWDDEEDGEWYVKLAYKDFWELEKIFGMLENTYGGPGLMRPE